MAKKTTNTAYIHWNGISLEIEWEGDSDCPEIVGMQLVTPSDLLAFADYAAGNKDMMDEIQHLLEEDVEMIEQDERDYWKSLRYNKHK